MQSAQARETAETLANSNDSGPDANLSNIHATIHSLKSLLQPASQNHRSGEDLSHQSAPMQLPLPAELVVAILRWYQGRLSWLIICSQAPFNSWTQDPDRKSLFLTLYPVNDIHLVERLCQRVYFPMRPVSSGTVAAMHGCLFFLMKESVMWKDDLSKRYDLKTYMDKCKQNFEAAIENYDVLNIPSFENIIALTMGVGGFSYLAPSIAEAYANSYSSSLKPETKRSPWSPVI
ncbi:hypothetical protein N7468_002338 [Penicillium chermesinum]|uniref:Uncharacterized protein n=1 Tax=Penicillium chermesinum TaxID=63820 RepID=A0A9W9PIB4_9EURO|nr:uncharacterized protein N7468_002338 [Penicillium chermesinum]KAJ5247355.1 hypothetical protein N7468_002338 [Penicillium chermesinum]